MKRRTFVKTVLGALAAIPIGKALFGYAKEENKVYQWESPTYDFETGKIVKGLNCKALHESFTVSMYSNQGGFITIEGLDENNNKIRETLPLNGQPSKHNYVSYWIVR